MAQAHFRFYSELNDFLPSSRSGLTFVYAFEGRPGIKDAIEALGVPHTEVDLILANGTSVGFDYRLEDGDRISVYPVFEALDISPVVHLRPRPLREPRFVLDTHLGRLAAYLRMVGFDALYRNNYDDESLAQCSLQEGRIILTRDRGLLKRRSVTHGYYVRATNPRQQIQEVLRRFDLWGTVTPFRRCMRCNGVLESVAKREVVDHLPPHVRAQHEVFRRCGACGQVYWRGSHFKRMSHFIRELLEGR